MDPKNDAIDRQSVSWIDMDSVRDSQISIYTHTRTRIRTFHIKIYYVYNLDSRNLK